MDRVMDIAGRRIGVHEPPYVIAEIGVNHDGSLARALELTDAAAWASADAVKLQLFKTDLLLSRAATLAEYQRGESSAELMLGRLELSIDSMARIVERAHDRGMHAIVTVFTLELVESARRLAWDAFKSASPDIVNRPLLDALARDGRPLIVSTGAATIDEVVRALAWLAPARDRLAVLQCVSSYPAARDAAALEGIDAIAQIHAGAVGYSDHTPDVETGADAVRRGALILEKHLTYDRSAPGPDHAASLGPPDFRRYVRLARKAMTDPSHARDALYTRIGRKDVLPCELDVRRVARQSLVARRDLSEGDVLAADDLTIMRPGVGIEPHRLEEVVGCTLVRAVERGMPVPNEAVELALAASERTSE